MLEKDLNEMSWVTSIWNTLDKKRFGLCKSKYLLDITYWLMHQDYLSGKGSLEFIEKHDVPESPFTVHLLLQIVYNKP
jgi:hypothetical protein